MTEREFAQRVRDIGGQAYKVGGVVRDYLMGRASEDRDYVVTGVAEAAFMAEFPDALRVGSSFPVYLLEIDGAKSEVAFARRERKNGSGYKGFDVAADSAVTIEEDLFRRDLTINSIALPLSGGGIVDPFGGQRDILSKTIRATSAHFSEDPVRALRAARLAAQLGFTVEPGTLALMRGCGPELALEPKERVFKELEKALRAPRPSLFFLSLQASGLLKTVFPWLFDLVGKTQPAFFHPEGDAFNHSMLVLDKVSLETERPEVRFAALAHDLGKGVTAEEMLPRHYGHDKKGLEVLADVARELPLPRVWRQCAEIIAGEHMRAVTLTRAGKIRDLLAKVSKHPIGLDGFCIIIKADKGVLPDYLAEYGKYLREMEKQKSVPIPEKLRGREIGLWRRQIETAALDKLIKRRRAGQPEPQGR